MRRSARWPALICVLAAAMLVAAVEWPGGTRPAEAGSRTLVCVTITLPPSMGSPTIGAAPLRGVVPVRGAAPAPVLSVVPPIGGAAPIPALPSIVPSPVAPVSSPAVMAKVPGVLVLTPLPITGAYVVPVTTTMPGAPGVTLTRPEVLIPPPHIPGENRAAVAAGLIMGAAGPAGPGAAAPLVVCY